MVSKEDANNFYSLTFQQKCSFFETTIDEIVNAFDERELNKFLKEIILNVSENSYIRKKAVEIFTDCVFLNKLKVRYELTILIDEWNNDNETLLEVQRLKDLFYFYDSEPEYIEEIYQQKISNLEADIVAESYYQLGLIELQKAFLQHIEIDCIDSLKKGLLFFQKSAETVENRIDAEFFQIVTSIVVELLEVKTGYIQTNLKALSNILLQRDIFSISEQKDYLLISFYRKLVSLLKIQSENVSAWLDFRKNFNDLFYYHNELINSEIEKRLKHSALTTAFSQYIEGSFTQPYFAQNFHAEISKIDARINETDVPLEQKEFLLYVKELAINADLKKKSEKEEVRRLLIRSFPDRNTHTIDEELARITDINNYREVWTIQENLAKHSPEKFLDSLVIACLKLQGNRIYREASENERNDFIVAILDVSGYFIKDQTRWSTSYAGKDSGEIDMFVLEKDKTPFTIIEALNLDSLDQTSIKKHIDKIFLYDTSGLKQNFILVYSTAVNFEGLWNKYMNYLQAHKYKYQFTKFETIENYPNAAELKIGRTEHIRNHQQVFLYHLFLNLNQTSKTNN